jgi:GNAT superfamily N-acetyltransferase
MNAAGSPFDIVIARDDHLEPAVSSLGAQMSAEQRERFRTKLQRYVRKPDRDLLLAVEENVVAGFYTVIERDSLPPELPLEVKNRLHEFACCTGLLVHPAYRRQGIGTALHERAEQWALSRHRPGFWLVTHRQANWYKEHFGFKIEGKAIVNQIERTIMGKELKRMTIPSAGPGIFDRERP